jgi:hypothetical protein
MEPLNRLQDRCPLLGGGPWRLMRIVSPTLTTKVVAVRTVRIARVVRAAGANDAAVVVRLLEGLPAAAGLLERRRQRLGAEREGKLIDLIGQRASLWLSLEVETISQFLRIDRS